MSISYSSSISSSPSRSRSRFKTGLKARAAKASSVQHVREIGRAKQSSPLVVGEHTNATTAGPGVGSIGSRPRFLKITAARAGGRA